MKDSQPTKSELQSVIQRLTISWTNIYNFIPCALGDFLNECLAINPFPCWYKLSITWILCPFLIAIFTCNSKPNGIHLSIIDDMNFSQEIYLVIRVLRSCFYNLTINQHCAWVPWLHALPSNKLKEDNSLFTSDNCQHQAIFLRVFHIVYESKRWGFVQPESISLQIIKNNHHIRFCLKLDRC